MDAARTRVSVVEWQRRPETDRIEELVEGEAFTARTERWVLEGSAMRLEREFPLGTTVESPLLPGFALPVADAFAA
jgi:hypothetical protein